MAQFGGLGMGLGSLSRLSRAQTRSLSAENPTGQQGRRGPGARIPLEHGARPGDFPSGDLPRPGQAEEARVYYQVNYALTDVPDDAAYLHAQWRRSNPLPYKEVHTLLDGVRGQGHYAGTYIAWGVNNNGWWGEGEIKFYMDGDAEHPTI